MKEAYQFDLNNFAGSAFLGKVYYVMHNFIFQNIITLKNGLFHKHKMKTESAAH